MDEKNYTGTIPYHTEGVIINAESVTETGDKDTAKALFQTAKNRLLDTNNWHLLADRLKTKFRLADEHGAEIEGIAREGYYFKVDIPGPGSDAGEGYDWVRIEAVETYDSEAVQSIAIRVRPAPNPGGHDSEIAHFYSDASTSTFTVTREGNKITAAIYDRNTKPNTSSGKATDKIRNTLTGIAAILGFSKIQWQDLTDGLIKK